MTAPNAELAYTVLDLINLNRAHFDMTGYVNRARPVGLAELTEDFPQSDDEVDCGTTGCFAGWTAAVLGFRVNGSGRVFTADGTELPDQIENFAADHLGITEEGAAHLFYVEDDEIDQAVDEMFGPRPELAQPLGTGCRCDWLGKGTPEHAPSPLCRSLRPDADRVEMQPPPCADHEASELSCPVCTAQRRVFYAALGRDEATS